MHSTKINFGRRVAAGSLALGVVFGTAQVATAAPAAGPGGQSVTLLTGDRVVLVDTAKDVKTIVPGKGRDKLAFSTYHRDGHLFVVPRDAVSLVAKGKLDERLFDVTTLLESGYGDQARDTIPLIVKYAPGVARARLAGTTQTANLASINSSAVAANRGGQAWQSLTAPGVQKVWLDAVRHASLDRSVPQIGGPEAWKAGYTGTGVKVAVLDTGVDETHPDLATRQTAEQNFSNAADNVDRVGHGTHVASTIAGTGAKSGGKFKGVAYDAQILDGKVLNDSGSGAESWIIAGMQWAVDQGAKIVNLSLGAPDEPGIDPLEEAVNELSKTGTLFVIAAGNSGGDETVGSPGSADAALTVGAVDRQDNLAPFSSRGPRTGDGAIKPDITAPGVGIVAAKAAEGRIGTPAADGYVALDGTSMATPHVAGSAALLAQEHPTWTGQQLKAALTASAKPNNKLNAFAQGSGRVDVARAISQVVTTEPTNASLGTQVWPHDDDQPVAKTVTYRNAGTTDVTLDVSLSATGPNGGPAPAGLLTASATKVTIPAGGTASVNVVGDTRVSAADGTYSGTLTASSRDTQVLTPVSVNREPESYDVNFNHIGLDGQPASNYSTALFNLENGRIYSAYSPDGHATVRLPKGHYVLDSTAIGEHISWLAFPSLEVTQEATIDLDYRKARQTKITAPDETSSFRLGDVSYNRSLGTSSFGFGWVFLGGDLSDLWTAGLGPELPPNEFVAQYNTQWTGGNGDYYGLAYYANGAFPNGLVRADKKEALAHVHSSYAAPVPGRSGLTSAFPYPKFGPPLGGWSALLPVSLPGERNDYYTPEAQWGPELWQLGAGNKIEVEFTSPVRSLPAGGTTELSFNRGVFAPALPQTKFDFLYLTRTGDEINVNIPLWGDAAGNAAYSLVDKASTVLYKDGVKVGESASDGSGRFTVPPEGGNYVLSTEGVRSGVSDVSTTLRATWTFRSEHTTGTAPVRLPISTLRFTPALDASNSAAAGESLIVPITFQQQASGTGTLPRTLTVEASFDGGLTWSAAPVVANVFAVVQHPNDASSVSLRAKATDRSGNSVEETLLNAYKLR